MNVLKVLEKRGFVDQKTHEAELYALFEQETVTSYVGFDPTASSLHVGHLIPIMALAYMQKYGHRPIALVGGGTGLIGDPSGKTEMRKMLTEEQIEQNLTAIKGQLSRFLNFDHNHAICVNNNDWLSGLSYIPFLRDIGRHFSVNRMIKAESYKSRIEAEDGLNFIEFNYMILQAYDFKELFDHYNCKLQMGGSDQWGNIVAGVELVRRTRNQTVFGITFPLITTSSGAKMGKTEKGAVWLDPEKTSPYEYYQFWVNTDDRDIKKFLSLFTFLSLDEIAEVEKLQDADINSAKSILAYEATRIVHGKDNAAQAHITAMSMFGRDVISQYVLPSSDIPRAGANTDNAVPSSVIHIGQLRDGIPIFKMFSMCQLSGSSSEARTLIVQGGAYLNGRRIDDVSYMVEEKDVEQGFIWLRAGKKKHHRFVIQP